MDSQTNGMRPDLRSISTLLIAVGLLGGGALLTACQPRDPAGNSSERATPERAQQATLEEDRLAAQTKAAWQRGWGEGHGATVACLRGERAQTDGSELRCEDQAYVQQNYRPVASP